MLHRSAVEIIFCVDESAQNLGIGQFASEYSCFHAEADTAMFYIYSVLRAQGYTKAVIIDTEDTDNYVQAAYVSHQISRVLCIKKRTQNIDTKSLCNKEIVASIIPLHDLLASCSTELPASKEVLDDLKKFVMRYVYCDTEKLTLPELRAAKWRAQKKKFTTRLPQDSDSLQLHLKQANYLSFLRKHSTIQSHPSPLGHWWQLVDGLCLPVRCELLALPSWIPVTLNMTDDEERDTDSECDNESIWMCDLQTKHFLSGRLIQNETWRPSWICRSRWQSN